MEIVQNNAPQAPDLPHSLVESGLTLGPSAQIENVIKDLIFNGGKVIDRCQAPDTKEEAKGSAPAWLR